MPPDDKLSVTMPPELGAATARQSKSVSSWPADAAADRVHNGLMGAALDAWEAEDGPFTKQELDDAAAALGVRNQTPSA